MLLHVPCGEPLKDRHSARLRQTPVVQGTPDAGELVSSAMGASVVTSSSGEQQGCHHDSHRCLLAMRSEGAARARIERGAVIADEVVDRARGAAEHGVHAASASESARQDATISARFADGFEQHAGEPAAAHATAKAQPALSDDISPACGA